MAHAVVIPRMGMTMEEATIVEWLLPDGADVLAGQPVMVLNTDKLDVDIEVEVGGRLHHQVPAGTTVDVGAVVAWVLAQGEEVPVAGTV